jgi:hypothetical protein
MNTVDLTVSLYGCVFKKILYVRMNISSRAKFDKSKFRISYKCSLQEEVLRRGDF